MGSSLELARQEVEIIKDWLHYNKGVCVYCGLDAEHEDHLIPLPCSGEAIRPLVPTVPACADCNVRINDSPIISITGRAEIVAQSLRKKYHKSLVIKDRTEEELQEFGRHLQDKIRTAQFRRQLTRFRLKWLEAGGACQGYPTEPDPPESEDKTPDRWLDLLQIIATDLGSPQHGN